MISTIRHDKVNKNLLQTDRNGIFISYAPYDDPQIAICVVIEGGDSGNNVAPVVRDIYNAYFYSRSGSDSVSDDTGNYDVIA